MATAASFLLPVDLRLLSIHLHRLPACAGLYAEPWAQVGHVPAPGDLQIGKEMAETNADQPPCLLASILHFTVISLTGSLKPPTRESRDTLVAILGESQPLVRLNSVFP